MVAPRLRLSQVAISSSCTVPWETMAGDARVRFCGQCKQSVYNIAGMTKREAERLIADRQGRLCARILRRRDGTIVTADCWARLRAARRTGVREFIAVLLLVVVPELLVMRLGVGNLRRLVGLGDAAPRIELPQSPPLPRYGDRMLGELKLPDAAEILRALGGQGMLGTMGVVGTSSPAPPPRR